MVMMEFGFRRRMLKIGSETKFRNVVDKEHHETDMELSERAARAGTGRFRSRKRKCKSNYKNIQTLSVLLY